MPSAPLTISETPQNGVRQTQVWFVQGKKANKEFKPPRFIREEASLSENKENIPPDDKKADPQHNESKEAR